MAPANGPPGVSTLPIIISNNFIQYAGTNTTTPTGILLKNKAYIKVYNNTIKVKNQGTNANCIWFDANNSRALAGLEIRNNVMTLENSGSGQFFYSGSNGGSFDNMVIDHNNYYAPSNYFKIKLPNGTNGTITTFNSLTTYKANTFGYGAGALNVDPVFVSATDLHSASVAMNDSGAVIASITHDIDGESRSTTTPDIGADEYSFVTYCPGPPTVYSGCSGYTVTVGNNTYSNTGVYSDTVSGTICDSIIITDLTIIDVPIYTQTFNECTGFSVTVNGNTYNASGIYNDTITGGASTGCDSIIITDLTVGNEIVFSQYFNECPGYSITVNGNTYSTTGIYNDTLVGGAAAGCDSLIVTNLNILSPTFSIDSITTCDSLVWIDGNTYYSNNSVAKDTLVNAAGCDSVVTLALIITNSNTGVHTHAACYSYIWIDGVNYVSSNNTATHTLTNAAGCDSVVTLNLTINTATSSYRCTVSM